MYTIVPKEKENWGRCAEVCLFNFTESTFPTLHSGAKGGLDIYSILTNAAMGNFQTTDMFVGHRRTSKR